MDSQQKGLLTLIKSAVTGQKYSLPEEFNLLAAVPLIRSHEIEAIVYYGAVNCGYSLQEQGMRELFLICCQQLAVSEMQMREIERLLRTFEEQGIDALPLKGTVLKKLYPKAEMRRMGDADFLIREEQYTQIKPVLEEAGYSFVHEWKHEIVWDKTELHLELHRMLIQEDYEYYYDYFRTGWDLAIPAGQYRHIFAMTPEDTFLFLFAHLTKHYTGGGIGLMHMVDLWVYNRAHPELNQHNLIEKLKKLGIDRFYENIAYTLRTWFEDEQETAVSEAITQYVFHNGVYGTYTNKLAAQMAKSTRGNAGKRPSFLKRVLAIVFPNLGTLQHNGYPILGKWPILLPFVWVARWFRLIFVHRNRVKRKIQDFRDTSTDKVDTFEKSLEFVGICFPDKE